MLTGYHNRMRRIMFGANEEPRVCDECGGHSLRCRSTRAEDGVILRHRKCECGRNVKTTEPLFIQRITAMSASC